MLKIFGKLYCFVVLLSGLGLLTSACSAAAPAADIPATTQAQTAPATPAQEFVAEAKSVEEAIPTPTLPTEIADPSAPISPVAPPTEAAQQAGDAALLGVKPLAGSETALATAIADLAKQQNLTPNQITLVSMEAQEWGDTSLGCPQEGMMYAQVITPGYLLILEAQGQQYEYHTDQKTSVVWCQK